MIYLFEIYQRICNLIFFLTSKKQERTLINDCIRSDFNTTTKYCLWKTLKIFKKATNQKLFEYNFVECGVWKGVYLIFFQKLIELNNLKNCKIYGFDTFEGMPEPKVHDVTKKNESMLEKYKSLKINDKTSNWNLTKIKKVKDNYLKNTIKNNNLILVKGKVEDTLIDKNNILKEISILKLDTCLYEGTKIELEILFPKVKRGGVIIIDNYYNFKGVKKATDEFLIGKHHDVEYSRITSRVTIYK